MQYPDIFKNNNGGYEVPKDYESNWERYSTEIYTHCKQE